MEQDLLRIATTSISPQEALHFVENGAHGACASFIGMVRNRNLGRDVEAVSYDVFEPLALACFREIADAVREKWGASTRIAILHAKGRLEVGGISVMIAVSTPHRAESFEACRYIIETLKHRAPIWKQEHYTDGDSEWVQGHALCQHGTV